MLSTNVHLLLSVLKMSVKKAVSQIGTGIQDERTFPNVQSELEVIIRNTEHSRSEC
jgi:hypothetical protein